MRSVRSFVGVVLATVACSDDGGSPAATTEATTAVASTAADDGDDASDAGPGPDATTGGPDDADDDGPPATDDAPMTGDGTSDDAASDDGNDDGPGPLGPSRGCGTRPGDVLSGTIEVAGQTREYMIVMPDGYDASTPYPLVFGWHGLGGHSSLAQSIYQLESFWPEPVVVVYPQGLPQAGSGGMNGWDLSEGGEDVAFFDALANALASQLCVDLDRVYSMGFSFGAFITNHLACYRGQYIRAIAAVSGGGPFPQDTCQGPVAAMVIHGETDNVVTLAQGMVSHDRWLMENGCSTDGRTWTPPDDLPTTCTDYAGCDPAAPFTWCTHVSAHTWRDWMNQAIVDFLSAQQ